MPDFLNKAEKRFQKIRLDGEQAHAALFVRPRPGGATKVLGAPGGVLSRMGRVADATDDTNPFSQNCILILTRQRLLAFGHGTLTGRVRELLGALDLDEIASMTIDEPAGAGPLALTIAFTDGGAVVVTPGSRSSRFVETFDEVRSAVG